MKQASQEKEEEEEEGEEEERKNTPNAGKPVCGLRRRQLGVSAIAELLFWKSLWTGVWKSLAHVEEFLIHQDFWETLHLLRKSQTNDSSRLNYAGGGRQRIIPNIYDIYDTLPQGSLLLLRLSPTIELLFDLIRECKPS